MRNLTIIFLLFISTQQLSAQSLSERLWDELERTKSPKVLKSAKEEVLGEADLAFLEEQLGEEKKPDTFRRQDQFQEDSVSLGMAAIKRDQTPRVRSRKEEVKREDKKVIIPRERSLKRDESTPYSQIIYLKSPQKREEPKSLNQRVRSR